MLSPRTPSGCRFRYDWPLIVTVSAIAGPPSLDASVVPRVYAARWKGRGSSPARSITCRTASSRPSPITWTPAMPGELAEPAHDRGAVVGAERGRLGSRRLELARSSTAGRRRRAGARRGTAPAWRSGVGATPTRIARALGDPPRPHDLGPPAPARRRRTRSASSRTARRRRASPRAGRGRTARRAGCRRPRRSSGAAGAISDPRGEAALAPQRRPPSRTRSATARSFTGRGVGMVADRERIARQAQKVPSARAPTRRAGRPRARGGSGRGPSAARSARDPRARRRRPPRAATCGRSRRGCPSR